jgi:diguanylate cyclase (GGDEF)-like protein
MKSSRSLRLLLALQTVPPLWAGAFVVGVLALVGVVDVVTGPDFPFSLFYILCAGAAAIRFRVLVSLLFASLDLAVWTAIAAVTGRPDPNLGIFFWTLSVRYLTLALLVFLVTKLQDVIAELSLHALKDPLTGASNRRHFDDFLERSIRVSRRYGRPLTIAYLDVDDFKAINDRLGHHRGDEVLTVLASRILQCLRPEDLLARLGGDEFVLVLPDSGYEAAREILARVFASVDEGFHAHGIEATLSMGALSFPLVPEDPAALLKAADTLLYQVKQQGKGALRHIEAEAFPR